MICRSPLVHNKGMLLVRLHLEASLPYQKYRTCSAFEFCGIKKEAPGVELHLSAVRRRATLQEKKSGGTRIHCFPFRTVIPEDKTYSHKESYYEHSRNTLPYTEHAQTHLPWIISERII